jgi:hypothetical protein
MFDPEKLTTAKTVSEIISTVVGIGVTLGGGIYAYLKTRSSNADAIVTASALGQDDKDKVLRALKSWRYGAIGLAAILGCISITMLVFTLLPGPGQGTMSRYLSRHDSKLFRHAPDGGLYDFARVIPDRQSLASETDLAETLRETKYTFDLFAVHGMSVVQNYENEVVAGLKRGVNFRVVLWDPGDANKANFDLMAAVARPQSRNSTHRERVKESIVMIRRLQDRVAADRNTYRGSLDLRCLAKPGLYSMWIKDAKTADDATANITILQYRGEQFNPSFRLSNKACKRTLDGLKEEFEDLWGSATAPPP